MKKTYLAGMTYLHLGAVVAAESARNPLDYPIKQWLFILAMAMLGGAASWYNKVKKGELAASNLFALVGEFVVSALAGLLAFLVCDYFNIPIGITGAAAGLAGHAGARALSVAEVIVQRWIEKRFNVTAPTPPDEGKNK